MNSTLIRRDDIYSKIKQVLKQYDDLINLPYPENIKDIQSYQMACKSTLQHLMMCLKLMSFAETDENDNLLELIKKAHIATKDLKDEINDEFD